MFSAPLYGDMVRDFQPERAISVLNSYYQDGQIGMFFCNYWNRGDIAGAGEGLTMLFGRDIFGKQSLCYRITSNSVEVARVPMQISAGWREIPQGVVVVMETDETPRNLTGIIPDLSFIHLNFQFKELWCARMYVFSFLRDETVSIFLERLENFVQNVQFYEVDGGENLLNINREILPEADLGLMLKDNTQRFVNLFKGVMGRRYLPRHYSDPVIFLFSGGVDSLFVALIASLQPPDEGVPFILVNVSFSENDDFEEAHDRKRGLMAFKFLKEEFPNQKYEFVRVNVSKEELQYERTGSIAKAISPSYSVLDDSIGCVVWFACRAHGIVDGVPKTYDDTKMVLVGSGSDEILGGYSRHRGRFEREGYDGLFDELTHEIRNIGNRNLGRDDRVATANRRCMLAPFLDESIVRFVNHLPIQCKVDFSKPRGVGDKIVLREALKLLNVPDYLYTAPKKAMQFGTRIAKLEKRNEKGNDVCARLVGDSKSKNENDCL